MKSRVQIAVIDTEYLEKRATNQVEAVSAFKNPARRRMPKADPFQVYSLLSQRDNVANMSIAMQSKKVAEAANRDSAAMLYLAILGALFFPGTFLAVSSWLRRGREHSHPADGPVCARCIPRRPLLSILGGHDPVDYRADRLLDLMDVLAPWDYSGTGEVFGRQRASIADAWFSCLRIWLD